MPVRQVMTSWVGAALLVAAALPAAPAAAQGTRVTAAVPGSLGSIPNGGSNRDVQFAVPGSGLVRSVTVSVTMTHGRLNDIVAWLISPDGAQISLFSCVTCSTTTSMAGTYTFSDSASQSFFAGAKGAGGAVVPPASYRPNGGTGAVESLGTTFNDRAGNGLWTLRIQDSFTNATAGSVTAATLTLGLVPGVNSNAVAGSLGAIPDGPVATAQTPGLPRDVTFTVPAGAGVVQGVTIKILVDHPYVGDLVARLIAPDGRQHVLFGYTGATSPAGFGYFADLNGVYEFSDGATVAPSFWTAAGGGAGQCLPGPIARPAPAEAPAVGS